MGAMLVRHEPSSVASVRSEIRAELRDNGVRPDSVDDVALVASELVGNAVRHALPVPDDNEVDVAWTITADDVEVSVADGSPVEPQLRAPAADDTVGRGLTIVDKLASDWGVEKLPTGKRVWARVPI